MAYNRSGPRKQQNETLAVAAICLLLGYLICWFIQVPAKPKVRHTKQSWHCLEAGNCKSCIGRLLPKKETFTHAMKARSECMSRLAMTSRKDESSYMGISKLWHLAVADASNTADNARGECIYSACTFQNTNGEVLLLQRRSLLQ